MNEPTTKELAKLLAPFLAMTALVAVMAVLLIFRFMGSPASLGGTPAVVSFDVMRYANAQRAVASAFLKPGADQTSANETLLGLSERTRKVIEEAAGPGTLVVLKQAVIQGQTRDITEEVLTKLGLPTNVPTSDGAAYTLDVAPTMLMQVPAGRNPPRVGAETSSESVLP